MELKKHLGLRYLFVGLYVFLFGVYIMIGLQPAGATNYDVSTNLAIPSIGLKSDVTELAVRDGRLDTPDTIVGSFTRSDNKTLLIGHSTGVFEHLDSLQDGDAIEYDGRHYYTIRREVLEKSNISMTQLLKSEANDTLILMTCAGKLLDGGDATHRLIITAVRY